MEVPKAPTGRGWAAGIEKKQTRPLSRPPGSALLLVVGATAALSALAMALLTASLISYEIVAVRRDGDQARLLAESAVAVVEVELAAGRLAVPGAGGSTWEGSLPSPPAGMKPWPAACGFRARMATVPGPAGPARLRVGDFDGVLVDVVGEGWCGRGFHSRQGRLAVAADRRVRRLY